MTARWRAGRTAGRRLYDPHPAIRDIQVDTADLPLGAHLDYWKKPRVIDRCAKILTANTR